MRTAPERAIAIEVAGCVKVAGGVGKVALSHEGTRHVGEGRREFEGWGAVLAHNVECRLVAHAGARWIMTRHAEMPLVVEAGSIFEGVVAGEERGRLSEGSGALVQTSVKSVEFGEVVQAGSIGIAAAGQRLDALERGAEGLLAALIVTARAIEGAKFVAERHVLRGCRAAGEGRLVAQGKECLLKCGWVRAMGLPGGINACECVHCGSFGRTWG